MFPTRFMAGAIASLFFSATLAEAQKQDLHDSSKNFSNSKRGEIYDANGNSFGLADFDIDQLADASSRAVNPSFTSGDGATPEQMTARISSVQGVGEVSPLDGRVVTVEAVVVGDFQNGDADGSRDLRGFYLQEEDTDADADGATSEGVFVFDDATPAVDVNFGDVVRVTGTVAELFGETQIVDVTNVTVVSQNAPPADRRKHQPAVRRRNVRRGW